MGAAGDKPLTLETAAAQLQGIANRLISAMNTADPDPDDLHLVPTVEELLELHTEALHALEEAVLLLLKIARDAERDRREKRE